jgi:hypothetical protein
MGLFSRKAGTDVAMLDALRFQILNSPMIAYDRIVDADCGVVAGFVRSTEGVFVYVETPAERWFHAFRRWEDATPLWTKVRVHFRDVIGLEVRD